MIAYYYTRDHLGSVREMTDGSGNIVSRYSYDPYGRTTLAQGTNLATRQYAGYYAHLTSGLYLATFRAFDSNTGRWVSRDPMGEDQGVNLYQYVDEDPIDGVDSLGLAWTQPPGSFPPGGSPPSGSHNGWGKLRDEFRHTNYLIFTLTCPKGYKVDNIIVGYDVYTLSFSNGVSSPPPDVVAWKSLKGVNCDGKPVTLELWEHSRYASWFWNPILNTVDRMQYILNTRVTWTCKCCK